MDEFGWVSVIVVWWLGRMLAMLHARSYNFSTRSRWARRKACERLR